MSTPHRAQTRVRGKLSAVLSAHPAAASVSAAADAATTLHMPRHPRPLGVRAALSSDPASVQDVGATHDPPTQALPPAKRPRHDVAPTSSPTPAVTASTPRRADPDAYAQLHRSVHAALAAHPPALTPAAKVALALELLHARQLELDLARARHAMHALVVPPPPPPLPPAPPSSPRQRAVVPPSRPGQQGAAHDLARGLGSATAAEVMLPGRAAVGVADGAGSLAQDMTPVAK